MTLEVRMRRSILLILLGVSAASLMWGQHIISARSGMVHYTQGQVLLEGDPIQVRDAQFPEVKEGWTLETRAGRAEVLLTPGVFLRLPESSSIRMVRNKLFDTRVEVLTGAVLVEVDELLEDNAITLLFGESEVALLKRGLYRVDAGPGVLRVYDGKAEVTNSLGKVEAKKGRQVALTGEVLAAAKFNRKSKDTLNRWSERRAAYIAQANTVAARTASGRNSYSRWTWSPAYGLFTFLPGSGYGYSPYGYALYSPRTIWVLFAPQPNYGGGYPGSMTSAAGVVSVSPRTAYSGAASPTYSAPPSAPAAMGGGSPVRAMPRAGGGAGGQGR
jgi:hypothetical protein